MTKYVVKHKGTKRYWTRGGSYQGDVMNMGAASLYDEDNAKNFRDDPALEVIPVGLDGSLPTGEEGKRVGKKYDAGKAPVYQGFQKYFPRACLAVAWVSEYGFRKYGSWGGWKLVPDALPRYRDAKGRHQFQQDISGSYDEESGLAHKAQEAWNILADLEKSIEDGEIKMMRGNEIADGKPVPGTAREVS